MSKPHKHPVKIEIEALMNDDGQILLPSGTTLQIDIESLEPVKAWCSKHDKYVIHEGYLGGPVTTTCGVVRKLMGTKSI